MPSLLDEILAAPTQEKSGGGSILDDVMKSSPAPTGSILGAIKKVASGMYREYIREPFGLAGLMEPTPEQWARIEAGHAPVSPLSREGMTAMQPAAATLAMFGLKPAPGAPRLMGQAEPAPVAEAPVKPRLALPAAPSERIVKIPEVLPPEAKLSPNAPDWMKASWKAEAREVPLTERPIPSAPVDVATDPIGRASFEGGFRPAPDENPLQGTTNRISEWYKTIRRKLPADAAIARHAPESPVISAVERHSTGLTEDLRAVQQAPWSSVLRSYKDADWVRFESLPREQLPADVQAYLAYRESRVPIEHEAASYLGSTDFGEAGPNYIPRMTRQDAETLYRVQRGAFRGASNDLRTTVGAFRNSRVYATQAEGIRNGVEYEPTQKAIVLREWGGAKMVRTANLIRELDGKAIFRTRAAALQASPTGKVYRIEGIPGSPHWWAATEAEARFITQNLETARAPFGLAVHAFNQLFRGPNLFNPLPHITKNMGWKYLLAGGKARRLMPDMIEFSQKSNPELLQRFQQVMAFESKGETSSIVLHDLLSRGPASRIFRTITQPQRFSSRTIFSMADPAMRYSLWKNYLARGLSDQAAANNVWVDLVRYGVRSELTDLWRSIPGNFFVPWRYGTFVSLFKAARNHPLRTALFIGAVDVLRELRYRQTGRWIHMPVDYAEGPVSLIIDRGEQSGKKALQGTFALLSGTAAAGPGAGLYALKTLEDSIRMARQGPDWPTVRGMFWGLSQLYDLGGEWSAFEKDNDPKHLTNILQAVALGERNALQSSPMRLGKTLPESLLSKSEVVKRAEEIQSAIETLRTRRQNRMQARPPLQIRERLEREGFQP